MTNYAEIFEGLEVPPDAVDWVRANPDEARRALREIERADHPDAPEPQAPPFLEWAHEGSAEFPKPILGCAGMSGAVLSEGEICVLSAAGGTGKSTLAVSTALSVAMVEGDLNKPVPLMGSIFHGYGGTVVYATYEDPPSVIRWKLRELAKLWDSEKDTRATDALKKVGIISMRGWPLYGPIGDHASYNTVPGRMPGWDHLWELVDEAEPTLLIIDPALTAFVGEANSPTQAMSFLDALSSEAGKRQAGILMLAHSTKSSRSSRSDPFHPGMVSGTGAWTDHVRGVLTMGQYNPSMSDSPQRPSGQSRQGGQDDKGEEMPVLRVYKANWGPSRITVGLTPTTALGNSTPLGFTAWSSWARGEAPGEPLKLSPASKPEPIGQNPEAVRRRLDFT